MNDAASAFAGVGFHCYSGSVGQQDAFHSAYPKKDILFTECSGVYGSDWWSDLKVGKYSVYVHHTAMADPCTLAVVHGQHVSVQSQRWT